MVSTPTGGPSEEKTHLGAFALTTPIGVPNVPRTLRGDLHSAQPSATEEIAWKKGVDGLFGMVFNPRSALTEAQSENGGATGSRALRMANAELGERSVNEPASVFDN